jgi:predicted GH43/DUF377 family glycosyl hydrolase
VQLRYGLGLFVLSMTMSSPLCAQAQDWQLGPFRRAADAPVIRPDRAAVFTDPISGLAVHWEALHTFNPAATIAPDGSVAVLYRAEDDSGTMQIGGHTSRLGLALSKDGVHFVQEPTPVFMMDNDAQKVNEYPGGVEDPRIVQSEDGLYVMTYTQYARDRGVYTIGLATSRDLHHWAKYGPLFQNDARFGKVVYKSAAIVTRLDRGRLVATKTHGKYWMYWGEITVRVATSDDLLHWTVVNDAKTSEPLVVLRARPGRFDSGFPETGAPPVLTKDGIVFLYNGKNASPEQGDSDTSLGAGAYSVGEALFAASDPVKLLQRSEKPVFQPEMPFEKTGQYAAGTTFAEGLVAFRGQWFLYYGTADTFVGVATAPTAH